MGTSMRKEEFYFDSRDGKSKLYAVRYLPDRDEDIRAVVQIVHGMAEHMGRYEAFAEFLTKQGFAVTGDDHLGHGRSIGENGTPGYFCSQDPATVLVRDVHRLKKITQALYPGLPYILLSHSMGSFIARSYMCRYGTGITGAILLGTGSQTAAVLGISKLTAALQKVFLGPKHVAKFIYKHAFASYNDKIGEKRTEFDWLTKDSAVVDRYLADPLCGFTFTVNGFQTLFELITRIQKPDNLEKIPKELPVLMASGEDDPVGAYGAGVRKAYEGMIAAGLKQVTLMLYPTDRHELLNETDYEKVWQDILVWLEQVVRRN